MNAHTDLQLKKKFDIWKTAARKEPMCRSHLSSESLYDMAAPGGLEKASTDDIAHLSACPVCMNQWALWSEMHGADSAPAGTESEGHVAMSWGTLKAAASPGRPEPLQLASTCGRFRLNVFPEVGESDRGMAALEIVSDAGDLEGKIATVRDRKGAALLSGRLQQGRVARRLEAISKLDLSRWTVVIE